MGEMTSRGAGLRKYSNTALSSTKQAVKTSKARLYGWNISNPNGSDVFVQFFDLASGSVTVGTTTPTFAVWIPPSGGIDGNWTFGIEFETAVTIAATTTATGSTAPGSALNCNLFYR